MNVRIISLYTLSPSAEDLNSVPQRFISSRTDPTGETSPQKPSRASFSRDQARPSSTTPWRLHNTIQGD